MLHDGYVVNNHADHKSRKDRAVGPLPNFALLMAYEAGVIRSPLTWTFGPQSNPWKIKGFKF